MNYDQWKLSNPIDDGHGYNMVSKCCGAEIEREVAHCELCESQNIKEHFAGDEGWTICEDCRAIEQGVDYLDLCTDCELECEEIEDYEYEALQKESYDEMRADGERDEW